MENLILMIFVFCMGSVSFAGNKKINDLKTEIELLEEDTDEVNRSTKILDDENSRLQRSIDALKAKEMSLSSDLNKKSKEEKSLKNTLETSKSILEVLGE